MKTFRFALDIFNLKFSTQIAPGSLNPWDENERKNAIASVEPITELHRFEVTSKLIWLPN